MMCVTVFGKTNLGRGEKIGVMHMGRLDTVLPYFSECKTSL